MPGPADGRLTATLEGDALDEHSGEDQQQFASSISGADDAADATARRQVAAVRLLLDTKRSTETHDILLATAFEVLSTGPKTTNEVIDYTRGVWAGAPITRTHVEGALLAAKQGNLIEATTQLDGRTAWCLTAEGQLEIASSQSWADDAYARCLAYLRNQAHLEFGHVPAQELDLWMTILLDVLSAGVSTAFSTERGGVDVVAGSILVPTGYDIDDMLRHVGKLCSRPEVAHFLKASTLDALDPSHPFGAELVTNISIGYILLGYLARRDLTEARAIAGSLRDEVAVLAPIIHAAP